MLGFAGTAYKIWCLRESRTDADESVGVLIESKEGFADLVFNVLRIHLLWHQSKKLYEIHRSISCAEMTYIVQQNNVCNNSFEWEEIVLGEGVKFVSPSASTSAIMSCSSTSDVSMFRVRMTRPSSFAVIEPFWSRSKTLNAAWYSTTNTTTSKYDDVTPLLGLD